MGLLFFVVGNNMESCCTWCAVGAASLVGVSLWALSKTKHPKKEFGLETVPVTGALRPINFLFDIVRGTTGVPLVKINEKKFMKQAQEIVDKTDTELFGSQEEYLKGLKLFLSAPDQSLMSASGILLFNGLVQRLLNVRRSVVRYVQENRDVVVHSVLDKPIIISGLPRTGSTMLYNLLSCDPNARTPRFFELSQMADPTPPVTSLEARDTDHRIKQVMDRFDETERLYPGMWTEAGKSHRSHPNEIEEDLLTLFQAFVMQVHVPLTVGGSYQEWYENPDNKESAYIYHRLFSQMLNSAWTPSHWTLKAPIHSTYLDALLKQYPDARIVLTHRDPLAVVPSWTRLLESYLNWSYLPFACDRVAFGKYSKDSLVLCAERVKEWTDRTDSSRYFNVVYKEMTQDPIGMVERIYAHFGLSTSEEFRENMRVWIKENRQGKYGRREYSLSDYELTDDQIKDEFRFYTDAFFKEKESLSGEEKSPTLLGQQWD